MLFPLHTEAEAGETNIEGKKLGNGKRFPDGERKREGEKERASERAKERQVAPPALGAVR
jgi:hypothetical protein